MDVSSTVAVVIALRKGWSWEGEGEVNKLTKTAHFGSFFFIDQGSRNSPVLGVDIRP